MYHAGSFEEDPIPASERALESLRFAARPRVLLGRLGQLFVPLAVLTLVPLVVSLLDGQLSVALRYLVVIAVLAAVALAASRLSFPEELQANEAMAVTALVFLISGLLMSYPMMGYGLPFEDAVFEAVSGVTTTGLSTLASIEDKPPTFLFARAWLQWVGGLGVVVLGLALLIHPGVAAKRLGFDKREKDELVGGTRAHARRVLIVYSALTVAGVVALLVLGATPFDAVVHALTAVSTGGFATQNGSLAPFGDGLQTAVMVISVAGAISFSWYYSGFYRRIPELARDPQIRALFALGLVVTFMLFVLGRTEGAAPVAESLKDSALMAASAQTTAGFSTTPVDEMSSSSKLVLVFSMLVGGEVGSTAGGVKIFRFLVLLRLLGLPLLRASVQRGAELRIRVGDDRIRTDEVESTIGVALSYAAVLVVAWLAFLAFGHAPIDALFDVSSALATAGLSAGTVGPELEPPLKGLLCLVMLMGRVETCAFVLLLYPPTWLGKRRF